jgi:hypothetical protein
MLAVNVGILSRPTRSARGMGAVVGSDELVTADFYESSFASLSLLILRFGNV